jgi:hypothetical protein
VVNNSLTFHPHDEFISVDPSVFILEIRRGSALDPSILLISPINVCPAFLFSILCFNNIADSTNESFL